MPELPEVEVVRAGLARHVLGSTIQLVEVLHPRPVRRDPRGPEGFADALAGRQIIDARRRGKYFWLPLDNGDALLGHLGMSGQMLVQPTEAPPERHLRVRIVLDRGRDIRFADQRMFGGLLVSAGGADLPPEIAHIARDPLDPEFDDDEFVRRARKRCCRREAAAARPGPDLRRRQHLRRRGSLAGPDPRRPPGGAADRGPAARPARACSHRDGGGPGPGRHVLRLPLRQRQRRVRLLRALAQRLRTPGRALPALRHPDQADRVHEPVVVLLPQVPAGPKSSPRGPHGRHASPIDQEPAW